LVPCYNEAETVAHVIKDFQRELPMAAIYIGDNNSTDDTSRIAQECGAIVIRETNQGKGCMVRRMFADIDADIYVMVDGDATYDSTRVHAMIEKCVVSNTDMVNGARIAVETEAYRNGHRFGNWMFTSVIKTVFKSKLTDILSGYRVFSRRFVKSFPSNSHGFEIETELTIYAYLSRLPVSEVQTPYRARPEGSFSKLSTYKDGLKILNFIILLVKEEYPMLFFSVIACVLAFLGLTLAIPLFTDYFHTWTTPKLPTAVLVTGLMICSLTSFVTGLILDTVARMRAEMRRLCYLSFTPINETQKNQTTFVKLTG
jgi:glycosyltransferase involved in cell wall biosynthesis